MPDLSRCASIDDLRLLAQRRLPGPIFNFVEGAAFRERTRDGNLADFAKLKFRQRVLVDVRERSIATTLLGQPATMPVAIAPTGMSGAIPGGGRGELQAARAAKAAGVPFTLGMLAMTTIEEVTAEIGAPWFQLCMLTDRDLVRALVGRAAQAGCPVLVVTVTWPLPSQMNRAIRNPYGRLPPKWTPGSLLTYARKPIWSLSTLFGRTPSLRNFEVHRGGKVEAIEIVRMLDAGTTWRDIAWLRDLWPGKLVLKGVTQPDEIEQAIGIGADGVVISNHGGNQLDEAASTISMLPEAARTAAGRIELLLDGGVRSGQDVLKALALGAKGVLLGRAHLYGLAAGGEAGVAKALDIIRAELAITAALTGLTDLSQITPGLLFDPAVLRASV